MEQLIHFHILKSWKTFIFRVKIRKNYTCN